jgi:hypothetical protein
MTTPVVLQEAKMVTGRLRRDGDRYLAAVDDQGGSADAYYPIVASRVETLLNEDDEEDRPTEHALVRTMELLSSAHCLVPIPRASVATTVERGIHVYWKRPDRLLKLSIPAQGSESTFIYHEHGQEHAAERHVSPQVLADWLRWFNNA